MSGRRVRNEHGFTLVEIMIGISILGIALPFMVSLLSQLYNTGTQTLNTTAQDVETRAALDTMVSDLRQAYTGDQNTPPIVSISSTSITFYSPDKQTPFHLREIAYRVSNGTLQRAMVTSTNTGGPPWTGLSTPTAWGNIIGSITNAGSSPPVFAYYDDTGASTATASAVSEIVVTFVVSPGTAHTASTTYTETATLRAS